MTALSHIHSLTVARSQRLVSCNLPQSLVSSLECSICGFWSRMLGRGLPFCRDSITLPFSPALGHNPNHNLNLSYTHSKQQHHQQQDKKRLFKNESKNTSRLANNQFNLSLDSSSIKSHSHIFIIHHYDCISIFVYVLHLEGVVYRFS